MAWALSPRAIPAIHYNKKNASQHGKHFFVFIAIGAKQKMFGLFVYNF